MFKAHEVLNPIKFISLLLSITLTVVIYYTIVHLY